MNASKFFLPLTLITAWLASAPAATLFIPVDEILPGMVGTGVTVFEGSTREEFKAHIIGVLRNVSAPRRNLILARLEGGPLAQMGVIQGMSGSPVYIEGKLAGAVSYALGAFAKEPIAGITPIEEMLEAVALPATRPPVQQARLDLPITREGLARVLRAAFARTAPFAERPGDVVGVGLSRAVAAQTGMMLRPIATPVVLGGFSGDILDMMSNVFRDNGFVPIVAGAAGRVPQATEPLSAGDPVAVSLITGDLLMAGTGTVTLVDGERVHAFGHSFYNLGPTQFPMSRAYVHTLLPSLLSSLKITGVGDVVGVFEQDRATAIAGTLGQGPRLIPITLRLESADRSSDQTFNFEIVNDQFFTPVLTYMSILSTLTSYARQFGTATFTVQGTAKLKDHENLAFEDIFTGNSASVEAATYVAAPITFVMGNDFTPVELEEIALTITSTEQPRTATLERVWLDEARPRAGQTVTLKMLTRSYRGEVELQTIPIRIPANATGTLSVLVADGGALAQWEQREVRRPLQPQSVDQMIRVLNDAGKNNRLYVRLLRPDAGAVVNGEMLSSLPPSVLAVFEADRNGGSFIPLRSATIGEWQVATEDAVRGSRLLPLNLETP